MTTFVFTDEQQDLRDMVRRFLAEKSPVSEVRRLMATEAGYDPAVWAQLGQLGLAGLIIPEEYGGAGCGPVEQLIVCEEMGTTLLCSPYLASAVLAAGALLASGDAAAQADLLPEVRCLSRGLGGCGRRRRSCWARRYRTVTSWPACCSRWPAAKLDPVGSNPGVPFRR
jgi:alkylation response protein AidB-like acyl-CoA dehydrogenase